MDTEKENKLLVIRPITCWLALAALLGGVAQAHAAPPPTSLSLPLPKSSPDASAPNAPGASDPPSLSAPLSAPLTAPLSAPLSAPQAAPQSSPPSSAPASSDAKQNTAPAGQGGGNNASLRADYDAAFQETLDKPSDPDVLVKFAQLAVEFGDIEGAISALERLLLIDDEQPEVKLELGVLYFRLGSKEAARMYLDAARKSSVASPETKARAEQYLKADGVQ